jgi:TRAM1-like protein
MVFHWIVLFTGLRAAMIDFALMPLAQWAGVGSKKDVVRFAEQAWLLIYYSIFWSLGMVRSLTEILTSAEFIPVYFIQLILLAQC